MLSWGVVELLSWILEKMGNWGIVELWNWEGQGEVNP